MKENTNKERENMTNAEAAALLEAIKIIAAKSETTAEVIAHIEAIQNRLTK